MADQPFDPFLRASPELLAGAMAPPTEEVAPEYPEGFTFKDLQEKTRNLANQFRDIVETTMKNRLLRNMDIDNEAERQRGRFKPHEIYIPYHVIADNISKENVPYINFIVNSRNAGIFKVRNMAEIVNLEPLERIFTSAVRYDGYEGDVFAVIDGHQLHGIDYLEVKYDDTKPGYFAFEQLGYENVWYPKNVQRGKFQSSPIIVRNCEVTKDELMAFPNIVKDQVDLLFRDIPKNNPEKEFVCVQKVFYRIAGIVYICWMNYEKNTDFLRAPQPLHLGRWKILKDETTGMEISRQKIFENFYTIVPFPYTITENKKIIETLGRSRLDEATQEAVSSTVSSIINAFHKASQVFWAPKNAISTGEIEQLDLVLEDGRGLSQPVDFFSHPYPDDNGMTIVNALLTQNKAETTQMNMAVGNREDYASRKTAKEIQVAEKKEAQLNTTQIMLFSTAWKEVLTMGFLIFKGQVELGTIEIADMNPAILDADLVILAAGETEVVQRAETLQNLQNLWPIVAQTPAAMVVLEDIIKLMIPSSADKYIQALRAGAQNDKALLQGLSSIIQAIAKEHPDVIPEENYEQLGQLLQAAQQSAAQPGIGQQPPTEQQTEQAQQPA